MSFLDRLRSWRAPVRETRHHLSAEIRRWGFSVGEYSYGRPKVRFPETGAQLTIGRYCSIADRVEIFLGGNHRTDWVTTYPFDNLPRPVAARQRTRALACDAGRRRDRQRRLDRLGRGRPVGRARSATAR